MSFTMMIIKNFTVSLLICFTVGFVSKVNILETEIWADKTEYLVGESISVEYRIKNTSDTTIGMNIENIGSYLDVKDEQGQSLTKGEGYPSPEWLLHISYNYPDLLEPGEEHKGSINLADVYGLIYAGEYTCYLRNPYCTREHVLVLTEATSNTIDINVKNPSGEEKEALDMFLEVERIRTDLDNKDTSALKATTTSFLKYQEVANTYPFSLYAPWSLKAAIDLYLDSKDLNERRKIIPLCKRLIEDYPDFHYFARTFADLVGTYEILKDKEGAITTMEELIKKHPNSRISERAEYWLKKIDEWEFE